MKNKKRNNNSFEIKLSGYLDYYPDNPDKMIFVKAIFDIGGEKFWLNFRNNNSEVYVTPDCKRQLILLNPIYKEDIKPCPKKLDPKVLMFPFFIMKFKGIVIDGNSTNILDYLFTTYSVQEIIKFDNDYKLLRFMIQNLETEYLFKKYLPKCSKSEIVNTFTHILETNKLLSDYKESFISLLENKSNIQINKTIFKSLNESHINQLNNKLVDNPFLERLLRLIKPSKATSFHKENKYSSQEVYELIPH